MSDDPYTEENVPLCEAIYGKGLISLGGIEAIDNMFIHLDLTDKTILDIGSGIGGMAYHLAEKHHCKVVGLEIRQWMADYATKHAPQNLSDYLKFIIYTPNECIPLPNQSMDICCSKGVLTNVEDKLKLFQECYRILNHKGQMVLIDWLVPEAVGQKHERLRLGDLSFKETQTRYSKILETSGFLHIQFIDKSQEYLQYVKRLDEMYHSAEHRNAFLHIISDPLRAELIEANRDLIKSIESGEQLSMLILASR